MTTAGSTSSSETGTSTSTTTAGPATETTGPGPSTGSETGSSGTMTTTGSTTDTTEGTSSSTGTTAGTTTETTTGSAEVCDNGIDDDDNGEIDEGCPCAADDTQECFPFPESGVGECAAGLQSCVMGEWGPCENAIAPIAESCDGLDNNCDGEPDETCICMEGEEQPCYPGPEGTQDVGICMSGTQACEIVDGEAMWGECLGFVLPEDNDVCNDDIDNNCDGLVDVQEESLGTCADDPITAPTICSNDDLNPDLGGLTKVSFNYTGADQNFVVPGGVTSIWVKLWAGGGGSWNAQQGGPGGGGGFALANLDVTPGETLTIIVAERGEESFVQNTIYGGGGHGGFFAGNGGGRSAIRRNVDELATAGGGGGAGGCNVNEPCPGGGAGGALGEDGEDPPIGDNTYGTRGYGATHECGGAGGTTTCGCTLQSGMGGGGSQFQGGVTIMGAPGQGGGGGGGGFFGGGSGGGDCGGNTGGGGGGGSSYVHPDDGCVVGGSGASAANTGDADYEAGVGNGGAPGNDGQPGLVVIYH